jgi:NAD(P)H dehydrogenase (quinone)
MIKKYLILQILILFHLCLIAQKKQTILITYYSETGKTALLANSIKKGASIDNRVNVVLKKMDETTKKDLLSADAIIVGSPVHNANPAYEVLKFIESWPFEGAPLKNKVGAVFVTGGGISSGEELTQVALIHSMLVYGMIIVGGDDWTSSFGASAITNEAPFDKNLSPMFLRKAEQLGKRVAELTTRLNK